MVAIENPCKIYLKDEQLVCKSENGIKTVSLEDIECVVLENDEITLTHPALSVLAELEIPLITTNKKHIPSGVLISYFGHYKNLRVLEKQLHISKEYKARCVKKIVSQKIYNQSLCLEKIGIESEEIKLLSYKVEDGDKTNIEGFASALYFKKLFKNVYKDFRRKKHYHKNTDIINSALNYTYAITRSVILKNIVSSGLLPYLGINHVSKQNPFNLADDLIECYRAVCDFHVFRYMNYFKECQDNELSKEMRNELKKIFIYSINIDDKIIKFSSSCKEVCESLIRSFENENTDLLLLPKNWKN